MKLKNIFEEETIGTDKVMVSLDNNVLNGIVRANESASFIISCMKEDTSEEDVINRVCHNYGIDMEIARNAVNKIVSQLRDLNLLDE